MKIAVLAYSSIELAIKSIPIQILIHWPQGLCCELGLPVFLAAVCDGEDTKTVLVSVSDRCILLVMVVQTLHSATHRINHYTSDKQLKNQLRYAMWLERNQWIYGAIYLLNNWGLKVIRS